ncbi:MAG: hypothetical protein JWM91_383 [Rhodospirillales bacterium]|nr:hypothetical protein [Rhodospirillales bacterium]
MVIPLQLAGAGLHGGAPGRRDACNAGITRCRLSRRPFIRLSGRERPPKDPGHDQNAGNTRRRFDVIGTAKRRIRSGNL